jgi:hypothetical protein
MLTASFMSADWQFRDDFKVKSDIEKNFIGYIGIDPIDAPSSIAAGYHMTWQCVSNKNEYIGLPACVSREK